MERRKCVQCGKEFTLTDSEIEFYKKKNFSLPKRCKDCRELNKGRKSVNTSSRTQAGNNKGAKVIAAIIVIILVVFAGYTGSKVLFPHSNSDAGSSVTTEAGSQSEYRFRNSEYLNEHFGKHGGDFDYATPAEYEAGASAVVTSSKALHKTEAEDGDDVYYLEGTNEFVIVSTDGYIRTYFKPEDGKAYFNRQ